MRPSLPTLTWVAAVSLFSGCADTHWERAFYEGMRASPRPCASDTPDARRTCDPLPAYDAYEHDRRRAQSPSD